MGLKPNALNCVIDRYAAVLQRFIPVLPKNNRDANCGNRLAVLSGQLPILQNITNVKTALNKRTPSTGGARFPLGSPKPQLPVILHLKITIGDDHRF
jgi:hypothetical protein